MASGKGKGSPDEVKNGRFKPRVMRVVLALMDACILNLSVMLALVLRFDGSIPEPYWDLWQMTAPWMTVLLLAVSFALGLYNRIWEYASTDAVVTILLSVGLTFGAVVGLTVFIHHDLYPISVLVISWGITTMLIGASRFGWRVLRSRFVFRSGKPEGKTRAVVYGSGHARASLAKEAASDPASPYEIIGLLDDDPSLTGMLAGGMRILGTVDDLEKLASRYDLDEVLVARSCGEEADAEVERLVRAGAHIGVKVSIMPRLLELAAGQMPGRVRDIDVGDLIGREPDCFNLALPNDYIAGRTVLVTGAGGSIGSEICRQLCRYRPGRVILLGRGENRIHRIYYELVDSFPEIAFEPVICNVTDPIAVEAVFRRWKPEVVFHAAAHKHVFLMECNPLEAVNNNVLGTATIAELSRRYGVERFVLISTDKATEPTSVMGATKAMGERIVAGMNGSCKTKFVAVRFGNVLGSAGSVVPIFRAMAEAGKPLTVTDPEADRYFMTIEEASFLVLQAGAEGEGGEVFVLDMGDPIKIVDIARTILQMYGKDPDEPGAIEFIGLRPGEKLHERLVNPYEELVPTRVPGVQRVQVNGKAPVFPQVQDALSQLRAAVADCDEDRLLQVLAAATGARLSGTASRERAGISAE